jgi:Tol biopolymer transport system component
MIRDLATNSSRRLTDTGGWNASGDYAEQSALSPDGRQVAYSWFTDKSPDRNSYDLRVLSIATAGSKPRVLYKPGPSSWIQPCAWTPDGRAILAQRDVRRDGADTREIVIVSVADGAVRAIKTLEAWSTRVAVSPDGRYIAYDAPESSNRARRDVFIIPLDGSREAVQIKHTADEASPVWSADGKRLLFISDRMGAVGLWGIRISGGRPEGDAELIDRSIDQLMGTDRDGRLYYTTGGARRNVYVAPVDASLKVTGAPVLFSDHAVNVAHGGAWSPDATRFAYYASRSVQTQQISALMIRTVATGEERAVIPGVPLTTPRWGGIRWFPDGRSLLVVGRDDLRVGEGLFRLDVATGALQLITRERGGAFGGYPSIAPDGTSIYYADRDERESVNTRIVRLDLASGTRTDLKTGFVTALALSPDGKQLAYLASPGGPTSRAMQIAVMPAAGGAERVLFEAADWYDGSRFSTLGWSADGRYVLFVPHQDGARNSIWRVPAAGGTAEKTGITATGRIKMPMESPGGGRLAYSVLEESPGELWVLENYLPPVKRSGS